MIIIITRKSITTVIVSMLILLAVWGVSECSRANHRIVSCSVINQDEMKNFLLKYNWHIGGTIHFQSVRIPLSFSDKPGDFPEGLYWAYNNVLSKDIGLDISPYKGKEVTAYIVPLKENLGNNPDKELRAIIIELNGKIVGSWLDRGQDYGFTASLNGKYFADIVKKSWGEWLIDERLVDYSNGFDAETKKLSPQQVIKKYIEAIDAKDYKTAYALLSKANQTYYLFRILDKNMLYNNRWETDKPGLLNTEQAKIKKVARLKNYEYNPNNKPPANLLNRNIYKKVSYIVYIKTESKHTVTVNNEGDRWIITLVKETINSPWRIDGENTG